MKPRVIVDADSCPALVRDWLFSRTQELNIELIFAANRDISPKNKKSKNFTMIICPKESQAADKWILANAAEYDIVVTRDLPLAAALLEKSIRVMNDRGTLWDKEKIRRPLKERELSMQMAALGLGTKKRDGYGKKEFEAFARCFDAEIARLL